jgi:hypothetical protein
MSIIKDTRAILKALTLGRGGDVVVDTDGNGILRANNAPLTGVATVASAAAMPVPTARTIVVTGTTNITSIATGAKDGTVVTFIFQSTPTFTDGNNLKTAGNLVATADDTITLVCVSDVWYEIGRSVN